MIDVVITTYNEKLPLSLTLDGFMNQSISKKDFQILIIDDGSKESLVDVVKFYSQYLNISYFRHDNKGRPFTRNRGLSESKSELIIWNEADRIPHKNMIEEYLKFHFKHDNAFITGRLKELYFSDIKSNIQKIKKIVNEDNKFAREITNSKILNNLFLEDGSSLSSIPWITASSGNMSFTKNVADNCIFPEEIKGWGLDNYIFGYQAHNLGANFFRGKNIFNYHLAHEREKNQYVKGINHSIDVFYKNHPTKEVELFGEFMLGNISLQSFENQVSGKVLWDKNSEKSLYNKLINF